MLTIRKAGSDDFEAFCALVRQVDAQHIEGEPRIFRHPGDPPRPRDHYESVLESGEKDLFLADLDSVCAGYLQMELKRVGNDIALLVPRDYAWISEIVVAHAFRRRGVGSALMVQAREWAWDHGLGQVRLTTYDFNADAMRFYESQGLTALSHMLIQRF